MKYHLDRKNFYKFNKLIAEIEKKHKANPDNKVLEEAYTILKDVKPEEQIKFWGFGKLKIEKYNLQDDIAEQLDKHNEEY